jgi:hypothetical protein
MAYPHHELGTLAPILGRSSYQNPAYAAVLLVLLSAKHQRRGRLLAKKQPLARKSRW